MTDDAHREELVLSYYRVRQALGYLGFVLPIALILGGLMSIGGVEPSISDYYHTVLRDIFVGTMSAIGIFLIAYPGHRKLPGERFSDDIVTTVAGIAAFGVAFLPNETQAPVNVEPVFEALSQIWLGHRIAALGHYASATVFLGCLGYICLVKFARTAKPVRRRIYRACGWTILTMTAGVVAASWFKIRGPVIPQAIVVQWQLVLWFEALAIWAFSAAWLTKGRADLALARIVARRRPNGAGDASDGGRVTPPDQRFSTST